VTGNVIEIEAAVRAASEPTSCRLESLFDAHHQRLYRLARRLASTADDARDLVQETFLRVARAPGSVPDGAASEEAWLVRILVNICRDGWRRRASRAKVSPRDLAEAHVASASDHESAFIAQATVWRALRELPPRRRAAIVLHELDGLGIAEVATLLGVSPVTVRWHLSRGRLDLARAIGNEHGYR
jgi:RNA polymerase sigma-70 factor (ECF subfamily)